jgi:hypothetical protein
MQIKKVVLFLVAVVSARFVMASGDIEYYSSFHMNKSAYGARFGISGKLSHEEAEKKESYFVVKKDENNRIVSVTCDFSFIKIIFLFIFLQGGFAWQRMKSSTIALFT